MTIRPLLEKLEAMEPSLKTIDHLYNLGLITRSTNTIQAGDWDIHTWTHSYDGFFTVGWIERVRQNGEPFPPHAHSQRLWLMSVKGQAQICIPNLPGETTLTEGEYIVVAPNIEHAINPVTTDCVLVFVTIPAEPNMEG